MTVTAIDYLLPLGFLVAAFVMGVVAVNIKIHEE
jgi:hypothetical protein